MSARGAFPHTRMRRLRASAFARDMVRESTLSPADFIYPVFVLEGTGQREAVPSMPGVERLSIDLLVDLAKAAQGLGIPALALSPWSARTVSHCWPKLPIKLTDWYNVRWPN